MNPLILIMLGFFLIGGIDRMLGNRFGLGNELEKGISQMGAFALSVVGFYCIGVNGIQTHMEEITEVAGKLPFDLSLIPGLLLASDSGGLPIAMQLSPGNMGLFSGLLLSSGIGCLLSFQLPVAMGIIKGKLLEEMMEGLIPGIITIPIGLFTGGFMLEIPIPQMLFQMIPIFVICGLMILGFLRKPILTQKILIYFGLFIRAVGTLFFAIVVIGLFYEPFKIVEDEMVSYALITVTKICVVIGGALVFVQLIMLYAARYIEKFADLLDVNIQSVMGLLLSLISGAAMLPLLSEMDRKGKLMNSAFAVMGSYVFGGQMAFVAGLVNGKQLSVYIVGKLCAGLAAIVLVMIQCRVEDSKVVIQRD